jgi:Uma2 family endonuclease
MSAALALLPQIEETALRRKKWTVDEVHQALEAGLFAGQRFELVHGEILLRMSQNPIHAGAFRRLLRWLSTLVTLEQIRTQLPISLSGDDAKYSEPEPDVVVHTLSADEELKRHPKPSELLLVVEFANSSNLLDSTIKRELYARSAIIEYWLFNLHRRTLTIHRQPVNGDYASIQTYSGTETVTALFAPDKSVSVQQLLD